MKMRYLRPHTLFLAVSAAVLTWLVITKSFAAYLADVAPQAALWFNSRQPEALANIADRSLNESVNTDLLTSSGLSSAPSGGTSPSEPDQAPQSEFSDHKTVTPGPGTDSARSVANAFETLDPNQSVDLSAVRIAATNALTSDPLNARAMRILGQVATVTGDQVSAANFMRTAAATSLHESVAVFWMLHQSIQSGDYNRAIAYADALLRSNRALAPSVVPLLARFAEQKASSDLVKAALKDDPPWRDLFFTYLPGSITDARTPLNLLLALRTSDAPPSPKEISDYLALLIQHKYFDLAYYTWLQFLPSEQLRSTGLLFNGNFDFSPSGSPFDWTIKQGAGVTIDVVPLPDQFDEHALMVDFLFGRVDYHSVNEMVLLAPGTYQFQAQYKGKLSGPRGLKWRLVCAGDSNTRLGESTMISGATSGWKSVDFIFSVPPTDCRAQYVQLDLDARMASEQLISGSMLFDQLRISHVASQVTPQKSSN